MLRILTAVLCALLGAGFLRVYLKGGLKSFLCDALGSMFITIFFLIGGQESISLLLAFMATTSIAIGCSLAITTESGMLKELRSSSHFLTFLWRPIPTGLQKRKSSTTRRSGLLKGTLCILIALGIVFFTGGSRLGIIYLPALVGVLVIVESLLYLE